MLFFIRTAENRRKTTKKWLEQTSEFVKEKPTKTEKRKRGFERFVSPLCQLVSPSSLRAASSFERALIAAELSQRIKASFFASKIENKAMRPSTAMPTTTTTASSSSRVSSFAAPAPRRNHHQRRRSAPVLTRAGAANTWGTAFRVTTFGESHGKGVGCVIDGVPPRLRISKEEIQAELDRRRPGQSRITTPRKESDTCEIYSGEEEVGGEGIGGRRR